MTARRLAAFILAAFAVAIACMSMPTLAHKPSDSYLTLKADRGNVSGQWDIALRDLDLAVGLDIDGDGTITWGEVKSQRDAISRYALSHLSLWHSMPCTLNVDDVLIDEHTDGAYAVLRLAGTCTDAAAPLTVDYRLLFDLDAQHRGLLKLESAGQTTTAIFATTTRSQQFAVAPSKSGTATEALASGTKTVAPVSSPIETLTAFIKDGVKHIASGFDHILFLIALLLPAVMIRNGSHWRPATALRPTLMNVAGIVTAFTIAHSITLSLAVLGIVAVPSRLVESLIAASVVATALDNLVAFLPRRRWQVAFVFGLLHGLGFASVLLDLGLPTSSLAISLFGFNLGVEIGQLLLVLAVVPLAYVARSTRIYRPLAIGLGSIAIVFVASGWFIERAFKLEFMPF